MYFDLQEAFDTVDHEILLTKLYNYGVRGPINGWFRDYLTNRKQFVAIGDSVSELGMIRCGVPRGSVLGPLLFLTMLMIFVILVTNALSNCSPTTLMSLYLVKTQGALFVLPTH